MAGTSESTDLSGEITGEASYENEIDDTEETQIEQDSAAVDDAITDRQEISGGGSEPQEKLIKLPLSRIRAIIKTDPDVKVASQDAVVTLAKAAELFIQNLAKEAAVRTLRDKRKTVLRKHLDAVFDTKDCFAFLDGVLESIES